MRVHARRTHSLQMRRRMCTSAGGGLIHRPLGFDHLILCALEGRVVQVAADVFSKLVSASMLQSGLVHIASIKSVQVSANLPNLSVLS